MQEGGKRGRIEDKTETMLKEKGWALLLWSLCGEMPTGMSHLSLCLEMGEEEGDRDGAHWIDSESARQSIFSNYEETPLKLDYNLEFIRGEKKKGKCLMMSWTFN